MTAPERLPPFSELYRTYFDDVWVALLRLGVRRSALEDAVHDVFMVVHRRTDAFEGRASIRTWLLGIARRIAYRYRRTAARTERRHRALSQVDPMPMSLDEHVARREGWRALHAFLEQLDERKRDAFVLGELEQLGRRELGAALGVSPDTAYSRLRAARARFSETFAGPRANAALAAGRLAAPPPARTRHRVWLALMPSVAPKTIGVLWAAKVASATAGLALGGLVLVSAVGSGLRSPPGGSNVEPHAGAPTPPATAEDRARPSTPTMLAAAPVPPPAPVATIADAPVASAPSRPPARMTKASALPSPEPSESSADDLLAETALLQRARTALTSDDAERALALLGQHRARFPDGRLVEEREASEIRARCTLGQARASDDARRFARAYPRSAYLEVIAQTCAAR